MIQGPGTTGVPGPFGTELGFRRFLRLRHALLLLHILGQSVLVLLLGAQSGSAEPGARENTRHSSLLLWL